MNYTLFIFTQTSSNRSYGIRKKCFTFFGQTSVWLCAETGKTSDFSSFKSGIIAEKCISQGFTDIYLRDKTIEGSRSCGWKQARKVQASQQSPTYWSNRQCTRKNVFNLPKVHKNWTLEEVWNDHPNPKVSVFTECFSDPDIQLKNVCVSEPYYWPETFMSIV